MLNRLKDVFKSFQQHEVRYVVIGGIAVVLYGVPRATFDLDILIEATLEKSTGTVMIICISQRKMGVVHFFDPFYVAVGLCPNCARQGQIFPNISKRNQK